MDHDLATRVRKLSDRIVDIQRPIRILDAVQWRDSVREQFLGAGGKALPSIDAAYYHESCPLRFAAADKQRELRAFEKEVRESLGASDPVGQLLMRMADEYRQVVNMLASRGTPAFSTTSRELYGAPSDCFGTMQTSLSTLASHLGQTLDRIDSAGPLAPDMPSLCASDAVDVLQERLDKVFCPLGDRVTVCLSDGIVADASAGADRIKLRANGTFTDRDLRLLEVHEGWVHAGTTLNGARQQTCTFLGKGVPSTTVTQEGLAVFMEVVALVSYPSRVRKIANRVRALQQAEDGADFLEVYRFFLEQGLSEQGAYIQTSRIFRGSTPTGGPFAKDIAYLRGFFLVQSKLQEAVHAGNVDRISLLFCGKVAAQDLDLIHDLIDNGLVEAPRHLPPQFADPHALAAWLCYTSYLGSIEVADAFEKGPLPD